METQFESAQRMYNARAKTYEDSWHPEYSQRFVSHLAVKPGMRILDLCCGTGLEAFLLADLVGDTGEVIGVDATEGMLAELRARQAREPALGRRIRTFRHDATDLASLAALAPGSFDYVVCSNAFVLFADPAAVVRAWRPYLRPGSGVLAVDVTHEHNMRAGVLVERAARRMGLTWPSNRSWVVSRESFAEVLAAEGYVVDAVEELHKVTGRRETYFTVDQADEQFDALMATALSAFMLRGDAERSTARALFREEFAAAAVDGKVEVVDSLYLYLARTAPA